MYKSPEALTATYEGASSSASVAKAPFPSEPGTPFPATVVITPLLTILIRLFPRSAIYRLPLVSTASPVGLLNEARTAGPLSPPKPALPFPAIKLKPPRTSTRATMLAWGNEINRLPWPSSATASSGDPQVGEQPGLRKLNPPPPATVWTV